MNKPHGFLARVRKKLHALKRAIGRRPVAVSVPPLPGSISREELAALPVRRYEGRIVLVATPQDLALARKDLLRERVVGFDTETRPAFRKGEHYPPCLVQLATAHVVYLFRLGDAVVFPALKEVMEAPQIVKAGVSVADDLRELKTVFAFDEKHVLDLGTVARRCGLTQTGVRNLAGLLLGFRITKGNKTSNWAAPVLTPAQISYAATDAWACRELYLSFRRRGLLTAATIS